MGAPGVPGLAGDQRIELDACSGYPDLPERNVDVTHRFLMRVSPSYTGMITVSTAG